MAYVKRTDNPNMGRPKVKDRNKCLNLRLSEAEMAQLNQCVELTGLTRTDVLMRGLDMLYESLDR